MINVDTLNVRFAHVFPASVTHVPILHTHVMIITNQLCEGMQFC